MIISIVIIGIITSCAIAKFTNINYNANVSTLRSQLSLIQNAIINQKTKNILLSNNKEITNLDEATQEKSGERLFSKIVDFSIISTNSVLKESGLWAKISDTSYTFYLSNSKNILFSFENGKFICKSAFEVCKEIE